jgi:hypothetical protein
MEFRDPRILHGGMCAWVAAGRETAGSAIGREGLREIGAGEFLASRRFDDWTVAGLAGPGEAKEWMLPECVNVAAPDANSVEAVLRSREPAGGRLSRVLLLDADGASYGRIQSGLRAREVVAVFGLRGGVAALEAQLRLMTAARHPRTAVTTENRFSSGEPVAKPCGNCPGR